MRIARKIDPYWTKTRVVDGLRRFWRRFKIAPESSVEIDRIGKPCRARGRRSFPGASAILNYFPSMYEAWKATEIKATLPHCKCGAILPKYRRSRCDLCGCISMSEAQRKRWEKQKKYRFTEEIDAEIRRVWREEMKNLKAAPGRKLAEKLGYPAWIIKRRARELGVSYHIKRGPEWTPEEFEILERYAFLTPQRISKRLRDAGFERTEMAVHIKLSRLKLRKETPFYTGRQLARLFGEDDHKIMKWGVDGVLPFKRKGEGRTRKQGGDTKLFHEIDVYLFLVKYRDYYDIRKVNQQWLLSVLIDLPAARGEEIAARRQALADGKTDEAPLYSNSIWKQRKRSGRKPKVAELQ